MSHTPEERQALLDACVGSGTASEELWKNTLLSYEETPTTWHRSRASWSRLVKELM